MADIIVENYSSSNPAAPSGYDLVKPQKDGTKTPPDVSFAVPRADVAGTKHGTIIYDGTGLANRYLGADGDWHTIPTGGGGSGSGGLLFTPVTPVLSDFSWVEQGSSIAEQVGGAITLRTPQLSGDHYRGFLKSNIPPSSITVWLYHNLIYYYNQVGLMLYNSVSGKAVLNTVVLMSDLTTHVIAANLNSTTSTNTTPADKRIPLSNPFGLRFRFAGGIRYYGYSTDGINWWEYYSTTNTDWVIPDKAGPYINSSSTVGPGIATLVSYAEL